MQSKVYQALGQTSDRSVSLGFFFGEHKDIMDFLFDEKRNYYNIQLKEINIINVTKDTVAKKVMLLNEKKKIEKQLREITADLENLK